MTKVFRFRFVDIANEEYREAARYYLDNAGVDIANKFIEKVETVMDILEDFPEGGRPLDEIPGLRSARIPKYPYRIYYRVDKHGLEVVGLSIDHSKRDMDAMLARLKERLLNE